MTAQEFVDSIGTTIEEFAADVLAASEYGDPDESLMDWISAGDYTGSETAETVAVEWDDRD